MLIRRAFTTQMVSYIKEKLVSDTDFNTLEIISFAISVLA